MNIFTLSVLISPVLVAIFGITTDFLPAKDNIIC
ncbi:putative membrane protein, partial [Bacteroides fragilis str. DS-71]